MADEWDAIVIGSGMGGLTCAAYLAASGRRVLVLEQHDVAGGNAHSFRRRRAYQFDVGTHYLGDCGDGGVLPAILGGLGVADRVRFHPMDPDGYDRIVMPNASIDVPTGWDRFRERLFAALPADVPGLGTFLDICAAAARQNRASLLDPAESDISGLPPAVVRWSRRTLTQLYDHCGLSQRARALLSAQLGNYGTTPSDTLVVAHASMMDDYLRGAYYPAGGGQMIIAAMVEALETHGGALWTRARVSRVLVEGGAARGVTLDDGRELRAPVVVSNADFRRTVLELCAGAFPKPVVDRTRDASTRLSLATLYVVLDTDEPRPNANIWWWETEDVDGAFERMRTGVPEPQFVILTFASVKDPVPGAACPPGQTNFQIMTLCPPDYALWGVADGPASGLRYRRTPAYQAAKQRFADSMLDMAERAIGPFRHRIAYLETATPLTQERYTLSSGGTPYGIRRWGDTSRRPDVRTAVDGLYLTGQSTRYGGGIVGASVSGIACASAIVGRALLPEVHRGAVLANPALLPERDADFDPLRVSRGLARRNARGMPGLARQGAPA